MIVFKLTPKKDPEQRLASMMVTVNWEQKFIAAEDMAGAGLVAKEKGWEPYHIERLMDLAAVQGVSDAGTG